jgi:hypothetical protein
MQDHDVQPLRLTRWRVLGDSILAANFNGWKSVRYDETWN